MEHQLTKEQQEFYDSAIAGENIFLSGKAGVGKTYITKIVIKELKKLGKKVAVVAPTGVAALNLGGATLHSLFAIPVYGVIDYESCRYVKRDKRRLWEAIDVLVIDEISMVRADMIDGIDYTLKKNDCSSMNRRQIIFVGDMKQLPAIADDNFRSVMFSDEYNYKGVEFHNAHILKKIGLKTIELNEVKRQDDPEFISALNIIRDGGKSPYFKRFHSEEIKGIVLAPYRDTVTKHNIEGLQGVEGEEIVFKAKVNGSAKISDFNFDDVVNVKKGCKIMYLVNSKNNNLINGTIGEFDYEDITDAEDETIQRIYYIKVGNIRYQIEVVEQSKQEYVLDQSKDELILKTIGTISQMPIKLAYALSIHKSQGLTFDEVTLDLSRPCFSPGQLYVGLSRVRTPEGLSIITGDRKLKS